MSEPDVSTTIDIAGLVSWFRHFSDAVASHVDELSDLDASIGDADHGANLNRGCQATLQHIEAEAPRDVAGFGRAVGMELISKVGGASGVLYGSFFLAFGSQGGSAVELDPMQFAQAWRAGVDAVAKRGKAQLHDKTMLDAMLPAVEAMERAAADGASHQWLVLRAAVEASEVGMRSTIPLIARKGRASYLGDRSVGHQDPGATSAWLLVRATVQAFCPEA